MAEKKPKKKMNPNSLKALEATQFNNISPERRREIARMGAAATNAKIKKRKTFREIIEALGVPCSELKLDLLNFQGTTYEKKGHRETEKEHEVKQKKL
jgi:hypothetical protein